jgi:EAL domain-containing protein (putative c-di-GMP-specific phosphodiesterase class I)/FixJ family two-component response regulator
MQNHDEVPLKQKILVLDDDLDMGLLIAEVAESMDTPCTTTSTPDAFLRQLDSDVTLIVLDMMMPGMDGVEILRLLAKCDSKAGIILVSGVGKRVMEIAEKLAGIQDLRIVGQLHKPFRVAELKSMIGGAHDVRAGSVPEERVVRGFDRAELEGAIRNDELLIHYQPQIDILRNRVVGIEALVRWHHPTLGLICPDEFIGAMETADLITDLGWMVVRQALLDLPRFVDEYGDLPVLSVNASVRSLQNLEYPDRFIELVREAGVPPAKVMIEITEGGLIERLVTTLDVLVRLRMKGIQLSIDDFGTGYSMMYQLRNIPAGELKVDRSFVLNLFGSDGDRVMVEKTIEIGHELGMKVVAEGVDAQEHLDFLASRGCDIAQGYYFSRPLPPDQLVEWLGNFRQSGKPRPHGGARCMDHTADGVDRNKVIQTTGNSVP